MIRPTHVLHAYSFPLQRKAGSPAKNEAYGPDDLKKADDLYKRGMSLYDRVRVPGIRLRERFNLFVGVRLRDSPGDRVHQHIMLATVVELASIQPPIWLYRAASSTTRYYIFK